MNRAFLKSLIVVLSVVGAIGAVGVFWLYTSLPQTSGERSVPGLVEDVEIIRDRNGIPHIFATNSHDAYFSLGFAHAQDRLWQMEFTRRVGAGRLSEIIGPETIETDRYLRTLGLYRLAAAQARQLKGDIRLALDAYVAGVNAYLNSHEGAWPIEFILLQHEPEPWRPADSLVWAKLMGLRLSSGWRGDLLRAVLLKRVGGPKLRQLFPQDLPNDPTTLAALQSYNWSQIGANIPNLLASQSASNAWVLSGDRTDTGKPILANDPHLGFAAPGLWYLARLSTPDWEIRGATVPGVPLTILGQNRTTAWGMTASSADTSDLFIETTVPSDRSRYLTPMGPKAFDTREEVIQVKGGEPVEFIVRASRHGPILSDALPALQKVAPNNRAIALSATILQGNDTTTEALYRINHAQSVADFMTAARGFVAPLTNLFAADSEGNIGFIAAGRMPKRATVGQAHLPARGLYGRGDWLSDVPPAVWPRLENPSGGRIANANNRLIPPGADSPYPDAWYWPASYRMARILEVIDGQDTHRLEDSLRLQMDTFSNAAHVLTPHLIAIEPESPAAKTAIDMIRSWDHQMNRHRPEPLIYAAWTRHLMTALLRDEIGPEIAGFRSPRPRLLKRILDHQTGYKGWCDDISTPEMEPCAARIAHALDQALSELTDRFGPGLADWRWGDAHQAVFEHRILRHLPILGDWSEGRIETDGGDHTVNRGQTSGGSSPYRHGHGAGYRAVYDLADIDISRYSIATGQSGNPLSGHYMDFLGQWRDGKYLRIFGSAADLAQRGGDQLILRAPRKQESTQAK